MNGTARIIACLRKTQFYLYKTVSCRQSSRKKGLSQRRHNFLRSLTASIPLQQPPSTHFALVSLLEADLCSTLSGLRDRVDPTLFQRAVDYLYLKEPSSSYDIERETPHSDASIASCVPCTKLGRPCRKRHFAKPP